MLRVYLLFSNSESDSMIQVQNNFSRSYQAHSVLTVNNFLQMDGYPESSQDKPGRGHALAPCCTLLHGQENGQRVWEIRVLAK